jgi:hypothetical protein
MTESRDSLASMEEGVGQDVRRDWQRWIFSVRVKRSWVIF